MVGAREPGLLLTDENQATELAKLENEVSRLESDYNRPHLELRQAFAKWEQTRSPERRQGKLSAAGSTIAARARRW